MHLATQVAYKYLSIYQKTIYQTKIYLKKKWYEEAEISEAIVALKQLQVLDDSRYSENYLYWEVVKKWKPLFVAKQKLYQKWIETSIVQELVQEYSVMYDEWMILRLKKLRSQKNENDSSQKRVQRMVWRWYNYDLVLGVVEE